MTIHGRRNTFIISVNLAGNRTPIGSIAWLRESLKWRREIIAVGPKLGADRYVEVSFCREDVDAFEAVKDCVADIEAAGLDVGDVNHVWRDGPHALDILTGVAAQANAWLADPRRPRAPAVVAPEGDAVRTPEIAPAPVRDLDRGERIEWLRNALTLLGCDVPRPHRDHDHDQCASSAVGVEATRLREIVDQAESAALTGRQVRDLRRDLVALYLRYRNRAWPDRWTITPEESRALHRNAVVIVDMWRDWPTPGGHVSAIRRMVPSPRANRDQDEHLLTDTVAAALADILDATIDLDWARPA